VDDQLPEGGLIPYSSLPSKTRSAGKANHLLILEQRGDRDTRTQAEGQAAYDSMSRWRDDLHARGLLQTAEALRPDRDGVRLSKRGGKPTIVDGPFT
jgi:hypothetical protein